MAVISVNRGSCSTKRANLGLFRRSKHPDVVDRTTPEFGRYQRRFLVSEDCGSRCEALTKILDVQQIVTIRVISTDSRRDPSPRPLLIRIRAPALLNPDRSGGETRRRRPGFHRSATRSYDCDKPAA